MARHQTSRAVSPGSTWIYFQKLGHIFYKDRTTTNLVALDNSEQYFENTIFCAIHAYRVLFIQAYLHFHLAYL